MKNNKKKFSALFKSGELLEVDTDFEMKESKGVVLYYCNLKDNDAQDFIDQFLAGDTQSFFNEYNQENYAVVLFYENELFVYNDRIGTHEWYYSDLKDRVSISLSPFTLKEVALEIEKNRLYELLAFNIVNPPNTLFEGVNVLKTAEFIKVDNQNNISVNQYWDIKSLFGATKKSFTEYVSSFRSAFEKVLLQKKDSRSSVSLSGGVDSGGVLCMLTKLFAKPIPSFSLGPFGENSGDLQSSRLTAEECNSPNTEHPMKVSDLSMLPEINKGLAQPFETIFSLNTGLVFDWAAKKDLTDVYFGIGVDNMLGASGHHKLAYYLFLFEKFVPKFLCVPIYKSLIKFKKLNKNHSRLLLAKTPAERFLYFHSALYAYEIDMYKDKFDVVKNNDFIQEIDQVLTDNSLGSIERYIYADWLFYYTYFLNGASTRMGKRYGVFATSPMYHPEVLAVLLKSKNSFRRKDGWNKKPIRDMFAPYVSDRLRLNAPKSCVLDSKEWLKNIESECLEYIRGNKMLSLVLDIDFYRENKHNLPDPDFHLIRLLGLAVWYDVNFDKNRIDKFLQILEK